MDRKTFAENFQMDINCFSKYLAALSSSIASLLPNNLKKSFFLNSGAEAVEAAIKISYKSFKSKKKFILYSNKSYHGKLIGSGSISGSYKIKNQFPEMQNCENFKFNDPEDLESRILELENKGGIYAIVIEPYSASLLESCSDKFIEKLFTLKRKYKFCYFLDVKIILTKVVMLVHNFLMKYVSIKNAYLNY